MRNARLFVVGLLVLFSARFVSNANAHTTDLNNRVTFYITAVAQTQVQGEAGLVLHAVLDNGTRNRITLRDLSSTAGSKVVLYGIKRLYGVETLLPRRTLALRSGQGVEIAPPDYTLVITGLTDKARFRRPFELELTFNRAIGAMTVPVTFLINEELEHGRGVIDIGPPAALGGDQAEVQWLSADDVIDGVSKP